MLKAPYLAIDMAPLASSRERRTKVFSLFSVWEKREADISQEEKWREWVEIFERMFVFLKEGSTVCFDVVNDFVWDDVKLGEWVAWWGLVEWVDDVFFSEVNELVLGKCFR